MKKDNFLTLDEIPIGSWWKIAQGSEYGYCVLSKDVKTRDVNVISTVGEYRRIDYLKLQYRYKQVIPNKV